MRVKPLEGKTFGATVGHVDITNITGDTVAELNALLLQHGALLIKNSGSNVITKQHQAAFGANFGRLEFGGAAMSNTERDGTTIAVEAQRMRTNIGNEMWHTDSTYKPLSSKVAMLSARELPPSGGGQTALVDMREAYQRLDVNTRRRIDGLSAWHSTQFSQAADMGDFPPENPNTIYHGAAFLRPLVKVHPSTGAPAVFVGRHSFGVCVTNEPRQALPRRESQELLASLVRIAVADESAVWTHEWHVGDTLLWDNRRLLHRALPYVYSEPRVLLGTRVEGESTELALNAADPLADPPSQRRRQDLNQLGRRVLAEELALQRTEIAEGDVERRMAASLPAAIVVGTQASDAAAPTQLQLDLAKGGTHGAAHGGGGGRL